MSDQVSYTNINRPGNPISGSTFMVLNMHVLSNVFKVLGSESGKNLGPGS